MKVSSSNNLKRYNNLVGEIEAAYHEASLRLGLTDSVSKILYTICNGGGSCLIREICRQTGLSRQTANSALRRLEAEETVRLENADGKNKKVCLTEKGKALAEQTAMRLIATENDIFASWKEEDVQSYLELTEKFLADLKDKIKLL